MARSEQSLNKALSEIPAIREEFHKNVRVLGESESRNQSLERAGRVERLPRVRASSCASTRCTATSRCGGHFREEYQTAGRRGAARRRALQRTSRAWEFTGVGNEPVLHKEPLVFENVHPRPVGTSRTETTVPENTMRLTLKVWRQAGPDAAGRVRDVRSAAA